MSEEEKNIIECECNVIHEDRVRDLMWKMPIEDEFQRLAGFFKVFGDPNRMKILWALFEQEMCGCDLAVLLKMTKSAISHQLAYLKAANLVHYRREGKVIYYSLADDHIKQIFNAGTEHINE